MNLDKIHSVYFLGIGGIGMSALARWFHANGYVVSGYDKTATALTNQLVSEGIAIHFDDNIDAIPRDVVESPEGVLVIYTPAIPESLGEMTYLKSLGHHLYKRAQILGFLSEANYTIAVAGTHGKTTTSSIIAHLLKTAEVNCTAFVGGIMTNYNSNMLIGAKDGVFVVEADEFDRSFLTLRPDIAIITSMDADHLDIYGSGDALKDSFNEFVSKIKNDGSLVVEANVADQLKINPNQKLNVVTYGIDQGDACAHSLEIVDGSFCFTYALEDLEIEELSLAVPGFHNVANAVAALTSVVLADPANNKQVVQIVPARLKAGINSYSGVKRRFEYILKTEKITYIDDYAHHPEEIKALITSVSALYPGKEITAVFQPHLFSRTRDFAAAFSESLSAADQVILLDIYPAREQPIEGITSQIIIDNIKTSKVHSYHLEDVLEYFDTTLPEVLLTIGAGDIDTLVEPIKEKLKQKI